MSEETKRGLVDLGIRLLTLAIPWLGGLIGLPVVGWVVSLGLGYLLNLLKGLIEKKRDFEDIDAKINLQVDDAKAKTEALKIVQNDLGASDEQKQKTWTEFKDAMRKLTRSSV